MADEMNSEGMCLPEPINEIISDDNNLPTYQPLMLRLEQFNNLSLSTKESKKQAWLQFLSVWCEVLQILPIEAQPCYKECARLLPIIFKATDFYASRKDLSIARENVFRCIDQLDQSRIKAYLSLSREQLELPENQIYYKHVYYLLLIPSQSASMLPFEAIEDQQCVSNHIELFTFLIDRVERTMPANSPTPVQKDYPLGTINDRILSLFWNLTDRTVLIPILLKCDLAKKVVGWLFQAAMVTENGRRPFISIAHNIARHDDGADELNKNDAITAIKQYRNIKLQKLDSRIHSISMALALLSTPEQLKSDKKGMNIVLNQLLQLVMGAAKGDRYRAEGFHVSEPLSILVKMFVVEERTLDYVLCHAETDPPTDMISTIHLFTSLFFTFVDALTETDRVNQFTLIAIMNILWSISFQLNYAQGLINNQKLIEKIKTFAEDNNQQEILEQYKPRSMEGIKQAACGILLNLNIDYNKNETKSDEPNFTAKHFVSEPVGGIRKKPSIMISYCHDNNAFCGKIFDLLSTRDDTFEIWIDRTHCHEAIDLWETIADGMERARIIVCLLSNQYFESKSCRQEFIYAADSLKKRIVPVLLENFEPKGWLGIRMTGMKYIRFRDIHQLEKNKTTELMNTILSSFSSSEPVIQQNRLFTQQHRIEPLPVINVRHETSAPLSSFDQPTSNNNDISAWFTSCRISPEIRDLFDFQTKEEMLDYAKLLAKDREKQMDIYARIFAKKYHGNDMPPHEFNRFAIALEQLLKDHHPSYSVSIKLDPPELAKSSACTIV